MGKATEQSVLFREGVYAECAFPYGADCRMRFPSRRGAREVWGNRPPGCGALWKWLNWANALEQPPRQAAGRVALGPADLGLESDPTERRTLPNLRAADCAFP